MRTPILCTLTILATAAAATAQTKSVTVRDRLVPLGAVSICQDGATHSTEVTGHRLRPGKFNLSSFKGPVEVTGTPGAITCSYLDVTAVKTVPEQTATITKTNTTTKVDFYGVGSSIYAVYLGGLGTSPFTLPGINGPIHINANNFLFLGLYLPKGATTPYLSLSAANSAIPTGLKLYTQAFQILAGNDEATNIEDMKF